MRERMVFPLGRGVAGVVVALAIWFALSLGGLILGTADGTLPAMLYANGGMRGVTYLAEQSGAAAAVAALAQAVGVDQVYVALAALAAVMALTMVVVMALGQWMLTSTGAAILAIWRALNGHAPTRRADVRTVLGAGSLLVAWGGIFGVRFWPFTAWEIVLASGVMAGLWRLWRPAEHAHFGEESRAELNAAATAAKPFGFVCLFTFAGMTGWHAAIATLPPPLPTVLAIVAAGGLVWSALPVERHVRAAFAIAQRDRQARRLKM